jgi:hypothetical protein
MGNVRQIAGSGAALLTLIATGCLSAEESLFRAVEVPEQATDVSSTPGAVPTLEVLDFTRVPEVLLPVALLPPAAPVIEAPEGGRGAADGVDNEVLAGDTDIETVFDPCAAPGFLLCDTFEASTTGAFPDALQWQTELPGCGTHLVDESVSLSGSKALRTASGGYPECMLHADLEGETDVFVRAWIRLGSEPDLLREYFSLLEWGPSEDQDEPELRIGLRPGSGGLCPASPGLDVSVSGLEGGTATDCTGFTFEPERWYCVQAHLTRDSKQLSISLAVDGETLLEQDYTSLGAGWRESSSYFKLGRAAYGASATGSVFHDDVAVSREPVPCEP